MTMTGTPNAAQVAVQNAIDNALMAKQQVEAIDEQLDLADNNSETVRRNKVTRDLVSENSSGENSLASQFEAALASAFTERYNTPELQVAMVEVAKKFLDKTFGESNKKFLDEKIKDLPAITLSEEDRKNLEDQRSQFAKLFKFSKEIVIGMGKKDLLPDELKSDLKIRRAGGSRGPSFVGTYRFFVETKANSNEYEEKTITLKGVEKPAGLSVIANTLGKEVDASWQTRDLKNFILEQLNLTDAVRGETSTSPGEVTLPKTWEVTLPAPVNRKLKGVLISETTAPEEEDEPNGDDRATESDLAQ